MFAHIPRWLRIVVYVQTALVVAIPLGGWLLQKQGESRDMATYPPPGKLVSAGGARLHVYCEGESRGNPTVVFNADMGDHGLVWMNILPEAARFTRACYVDRPGFGWSDPGGEDRSITRTADDIHQALAAAGERPPYLLAGHGLGALHMAVVAVRHPSETAALLMLDPLVPDCLDERFRQIVARIEGPDKDAIRAKLDEVIEERGACPEGEGGTALYSFLARIGMIRALAGKNFDPTSPSPQLLPMHRALKMRTGFADASVQESRTAYVGMQEARDALSRLRGIPVRILSRGRMGNFPEDQEFLTRRADAATLAFEKAQLQATQQAHHEMARQAGGSATVIPEAPHYVHLSAPGKVVDALRELVQPQQAPQTPLQ